MLKRTLLHATLLSLLTLITCAAKPHLAPDSSTAIQTNKTSYTLDVDGHRYLLTLRATYINRTGKAVYFTRFCENADTPWFSLEKRTEMEWKVALEIPCLAVGGVPPIVVAAGETYTAEVEATAYKGRVIPSFYITPIPGRYRLVFEAYAEVDESNAYVLSDPLPISQRVSNVFTLNLP